jgi:uncharacterized membrane protein
MTIIVKAKMKKDNINRVVVAGLIAAVYAAATLICNLVLPGISWGPVQIRISEAICSVALLTPSAVPGLTLGCVIANALNTAISGTGALGILDIIFGSLATFIGASICWKMREKGNIALLAFVFSNALIVPAYLPILLQFSGYYTIPFTTISLDGMWIWMYLFGVVSLCISQSIVLFVLGIPIKNALNSHNKLVSNF